MVNNNDYFWCCQTQSGLPVTHYSTRNGATTRMTKRVGMYHDRSGWGIKKSGARTPQAVPRVTCHSGTSPSFGPCIIKGPAVKTIHATQSANPFHFFLSYSLSYISITIIPCLLSALLWNRVFVVHNFSRRSWRLKIPFPFSKMASILDGLDSLVLGKSLISYLLKDLDDW